jgi:RHH-type transcriptional regulator, proline utilization regulon repressor / proline dehydrogenase / delta 1-pyrroline-5-carboxylate dehydrogenase
LPARAAVEDHGDPDDERRIAEAVALARRFVEEATALDAHQSRTERRRRDRLRTLVADGRAAAFTVALTDEVAAHPRPVASAAGASPGWCTRPTSRVPGRRPGRARAGGRAGPAAAAVVMPLVTRRLRNESAGVILPAEDPAFAQHLARRRREGMRANVNVLGEAIIGELEAPRRRPPWSSSGWGDTTWTTCR